MSTGTGTLLPRALIVPALLGLAFLVLPLIALIARVQWGTFWADITSTEAAQALGLSLGTGLAATGLCVLLGLPLALLIARMVGGVALLFLFGRRGWVGSLLAEAGMALPFTTTAVIMAQTFVALPFLVLAVEGSLRATGTDLEQVAAGLGAGR